MVDERFLTEFIHKPLPDTPLSEYNIFDVLGVKEKEVVMSRFLTDLLYPEGQHGCGILFLKSFFRDILKESRVSDTLLAHTKVVSEFTIDHERRIDIAIYNTWFFIPIEVKIFAGDRTSQCYDYFEYAKTKTVDGNTRIIYLTISGKEPAIDSRKAKYSDELLPKDKITCISWKRDVCKWLTKLLVQLKEPVKMMVMQYIDAINLVADWEDDRSMEKYVDILHKSADYFSAGLQIEKSMKAAKLKLIQLVFDDLKAEMDQIAPKYGLELEKNHNYYSYDDIKQHERFYDDAGSTYPGLNYVIKKAEFHNTNIKMWFRIEVEQKLYAGITLFDTDEGYEVENISDELIEEAAGFLNRDLIMPEGWWLTWCYSNGKYRDDYYADVPDFKEMNECAVWLVDARKRADFVKRAVAVFEGELLQYLL